MSAEVTAWAVPGIGEIGPGHDLTEAILAGLDAGQSPLRDGDVVVVASKIVAKAEGRTVPEAERDDAITAEATHLVAARALPDGRTTRVVHTRVGPVLAAAGVDASDVAEGTVLLLPADPDDSARRLRAELNAATSATIGVIVTDTSGRPWRSGVSDYCLGAAGVAVLDDRRGSLDAAGRPLSVTVRNLADEIACLADLVKGKSAGTPVAVIRGLDIVTVEDGPGAVALTRTGPSDWFRHGHVEAVWASLARPGVAATVRAPSIDPAAESVGERVRRAITLALACPGVDDVAVDASDREIGITGPAWQVGRVMERLLSAGWAEDIELTVGEVGESTGECRVCVLIR